MTKPKIYTGPAIPSQVAEAMKQLAMPLVNLPPRESGVDPDHNAREALAFTIENMLSRQARYAVVTFDKRGKLMIFDVSEGFRMFGVQQYEVSVELFKAELNTVNVFTSGAGLFATSLKAAEKRRTVVMKWLRELEAADYESRDSEYYLSDVRCMELLTIVRLDTTAVAVHPTKKSKGTK